MTSYFTHLPIKKSTSILSFIFISFWSVSCIHAMDPEPTEEEAQKTEEKTFLSIKESRLLSSLDLDKEFKAKIESHESVLGLNLSDSRIYPKQFSVLCENLPQFTALTHLSLAGNNLIAPGSDIDMHQLDADTQVLVSGLSSLTHLQVLDLSGNPFHRFDGFFSLQILNAFRGCSETLEELHLQNCNMNSKIFCVLGAALTFYPNLKKLNLSENKFLLGRYQKEISTLLNQIFHTSRLLKILNMNNTCPFFEPCFSLNSLCFPETLETLNLSVNHKIKSTTFSETFKKTPNLKHLYLGSSCISFDDSDKEGDFWEALSGLSFLETVFLSGNNFSLKEEVIPHTAEQISKMTSLKIFSCDRFVHYNLEQFESLVKILGGLPNLEAAYFSESSDDMKNLRAYQLGQKKVFLKYPPQKEKPDSLLAPYFPT